MPLPTGSEPIATGIVATLLIIWSKIRFVGKSDFEIHKSDCEGRIGARLDAIVLTQEKIFDRMDTFTHHQGAVEQFMKMKGG